MEESWVFGIWPNAANENIFAANGVHRLRIHLFAWVVLNNDTRGMRQCLANIIGSCLVVFDFEVHFFRVGNWYRNSNTGCGYFDGIAVHIPSHDLLGFVDHFPFFMAIAIRFENIDLRQGIEGDRIMFLVTRRW